MNRLWSRRTVPLLSIGTGQRWGCNFFKASLQASRCHATRGYQIVPPVKTAIGQVDLDRFRNDFWVPELPLAFHSFHSFPAARTWFAYGPDNSQVSFRERMEKYDKLVFPYEFIDPSALQLKNLQEFQDWFLNSEQNSKHPTPYIPRLLDYIINPVEEEDDGGDGPRFHQFQAPFSLLMRACEFNHIRSKPSERISKLYIAQSNLDNLPADLSEDLPVPEIVKSAGRGDIYASSIWMGLEPTYTPLHRDPNPNLFCQIIGSKIIRLMRPHLGLGLFTRVQQKLGSTGDSRFRGPEMMKGPERELLHHAVWIDEGSSEDVVQAVLGPGDALFIPKGWWHSVVSSGDEAKLNVSVNWWFR